MVELVGAGAGEGQTRNQGNFGAVWEEYVERPCRSAGGDGERVLWLSSTLLEVDEADGFDGKAEDCGSVGGDSGYESCHEER